MSGNIKQVIVMRTDLGMRKGKMIAQGAHASMKVFFDRQVRGFGSTINERLDPRAEDVLVVPLDAAMAAWVEGSFTKVCVQVDSEELLRDIVAKAQAAGLPVALIEDSGKTEFNTKCHLCDGYGSFAPAVADRDAFGNKCPNCKGTGKIPKPTVTCCAIGPAEAEVIDRITGGLRLL